MEKAFSEAKITKKGSTISLSDLADKGVIITVTVLDLKGDRTVTTAMTFGKEAAIGLKDMFNNWKP